MKLNALFSATMATTILLMALAMAACSTSDEPLAPPTTVMPVKISIPAAGFTNITRTPGDPGTYEPFSLPQHLYIFIVEEDGLGTTRVVNDVTHFDLSESKWTKTTLGASTLPNEGDSIYELNDRLELKLPDDRTSKTARVYAALSHFPLTLATPSTEDQVCDLTFSIDPTVPAQLQHLQDLYSTPYHLGSDGQATASRSSYYGAVSAYEDVQPSVNLMLYHVAAKVDLLWNVAPAMQSTLRLSQLQLQQLRCNDCLLFRPMENSGAGTTPYTLNIALDEGSQWYGRAYRYVIPYTEGTGATAYMPVTIQATDADGHTKTNTHQFGIDLTQSPVFTPWLRSIITIDAAFTGAPGSPGFPEFPEYPEYPEYPGYPGQAAAHY